MSNIYGYARVSTKNQVEGNSLEQQIGEISEAYPKAVIYEESYSGKTMDRPVFNKLLEKLKSGDILVVTKLDRFARSLTEGSKIVNDLINKGIKINILNIGLMDNTAASKLIRNIFFSFAEFERDMIIERTREGRTIARQKEGYKEGRPKKFTKKQLDHALSLLIVNGGNNSYKEVEEITNISKSTLIRENNERKKKMG